MTHIVIVPNVNKDEGYRLTERVIRTLIDLGAVVYLEEGIAPHLTGVCRYTELPSETELILVVGGDGSVLDTAPLAIRHGVPLVGVNCGRLGYLTEIEPEELSLLSRLFTGEYRIEEKMLLEVSTEEGGAERFALNDCILLADGVGIGEFQLETTDAERVRYRGDGLVIATPVGSTAYSLSAGGPIVSHGVDAMLVTPVCPHSFFNRSIVFGGGETLRVSSVGEGGMQIQIDGRSWRSLGTGGVCTVRVAKTRLRMLTLTDNRMISALFRKMRAIENI